MDFLLFDDFDFGFGTRGFFLMYFLFGRAGAISAAGVSRVGGTVAGGDWTAPAEEVGATSNFTVAGSFSSPSDDVDIC